MSSLLTNPSPRWPDSLPMNCPMERRALTGLEAFDLVESSNARRSAPGYLSQFFVETDEVCDSSPVWKLREFAEVNSTNLVAAKLPAWHAVRAATQTAGRGRFQRSWVSDAGGLWLSAIVPVETNSPAWRMLPLATGVAVCEALHMVGVKQLRLRWPNDVLVGDAKLAGLLIDQFTPGLAVVGIGINVSNHPEEQDAALRGHVARLAGLVSFVPSLSDLTERVLASLKSTWLEVQASGPESLLPRVNAFWDLPRRVQLDINDKLVNGEFGGVDARGRLQLRLDDGATKLFEPQEVKLLRDISQTNP